MHLDNPKIETDKLYFVMQFKIRIEAKRFHARILLDKLIATKLKRLHTISLLIANKSYNPIKGFLEKKSTEISQG